MGYYGSVSFDAMAIFNIVGVGNYIDITQNATNSKLQILVVDRWRYTEEDLSQVK